MFIDKNSLIINGVNFGQYIVQAQYSFNKLWSSDSGRNLAGTQSGTLIGIFPKIVVEFGKLTKADLEVITPILDNPRQTVSYYDPTKHTTVTMSTYTGDYEITNKNIVNGNKRSEGFNVSFISISKRL